MHRALRFGIFSSALIWFAALTGCVTDGLTGGTNANPQIPVPASTAQLRPGDSLNIALQGVPDASQNAVQIDEQGLISLPFIGTLQAAGASTAELSQRIRETYVAKKIYTAVDVSVSVTERYVYVGGEVQRPGRIVWTPDLTAAKAIQSAGGFSLYAKENGVVLIRENKAYTLDVKLAQKNPTQDPRLMPGDSLQVSRSPF
jgi:protein involved in polysaccharide export with SLBB domain